MYGGRGYAIAAIIIGSLSTIIWLLVFLAIIVAVVYVKNFFASPSERALRCFLP